MPLKDDSPRGEILFSQGDERNAMLGPWHRGHSDSVKGCLGFGAPSTPERPDIVRAELRNRVDERADRLHAEKHFRDALILDDAPVRVN